jgi:hypothetical protein
VLRDAALAITDAPFAIDAGQSVRSYGRGHHACEVKNCMPYSPGNNPCSGKTRAGIWRRCQQDRAGVLRQGTLRQRPAQSRRPRLGRGLAPGDPAWATSCENWPEPLPGGAGFELPAGRCASRCASGGWPMYWRRGAQEARAAPEYGGDGSRSASAPAAGPVAAYPAHWPPTISRSTRPNFRSLSQRAFIATRLVEPRARVQGGW